jgi:photosystem II oxygen-evolving enhancer protein 2
MAIALKKIAALILVILSLSLQSCGSLTPTSGLKAYIDGKDGYQFFYPNGWLPVEVNKKADAVFHDLINPSENVSVVIGTVPEDKNLADLGQSGEVGYKLIKTAIAPPGSGKSAELLAAETRQLAGKTYYILEYAVQLANQQRHNLASVVVSRGKLFTFNASTSEQRWGKVKPIFEQMIKTFAVN